jgi:hypothetical protein
MVVRDLLCLVLSFVSVATFASDTSNAPLLPLFPAFLSIPICCSGIPSGRYVLSLPSGCLIELLVRTQLFYQWRRAYQAL